MSDTVVRAFELPMQSVDRPEVWPLLRECWHHSASLANWCVSQLLRNDVVRTPDLEKLPKMPKIDLYNLAFVRKQYAGHEFFVGAKGSATSIIQPLQAKYIAERLNVIWHRKQAHCTYRSPHPWPVRADMWREASFDDEKRPFVRVALPGGQATIRLRGGPEFARQMAIFRQIVDGGLPRLELVIREHRQFGKSRRPTEPGGSRVMVKIVARLPVRETKGEKVLTLFCDKEAFWVASLSGRRDDRQWTANYDHVRRLFGWLAAHESRRQRLAQDSKAESRCASDKRRQWQRSLDAACEKQHRRLSSWLHEIAAHVVGFCSRQKVREVVYDDSQRFSDAFPWHRLNAMLADKLKAEGITLHVAEIGNEESVSL